MSLNHSSLPISKISGPIASPKLNSQSLNHESKAWPDSKSLVPAPLATSTDHAPTRAQSQLVLCVYIALRCSHCGELRQALHVTPSSESVACPECGATCSFIVLGFGLTKTQLPFHEILSREQMRWIVRDVETIDCS
jgi:hypothetical protein